ncbi:MAG: Alpha-ketoglutarate-dependent dioxygenase [Pseudomonadota bacterium]|jgi:DNA oxidative demethylase
MLFPVDPVELAPDFWLLSGFALGRPLREGIGSVIATAPFRHLIVPSGKKMAVAMSNCGPLGWTSSSRGYQYLPQDPDSQLPWPAMPDAFIQLAREAAATVGWKNYSPEACLINRYAPGAGLGLHQDRDELDLTQPIVSVSIGASCKFILGGLQRNDPVRSVALHDGDVVVWGGRSRLVFHGVRPLPATTKELRYNLTFRKVK